MRNKFLNYTLSGLMACTMLVGCGGAQTDTVKVFTVTPTEESGIPLNNKAVFEVGDDGTTLETFISCSGVTTESVKKASKELGQTPEKTYEAYRMVYSDEYKNVMSGNEALTWLRPDFEAVYDEGVYDLTLTFMVDLTDENFHADDKDTVEWMNDVLLLDTGVYYNADEMRYEVTEEAIKKDFGDDFTVKVEDVEKEKTPSAKLNKKLDDYKQVAEDLEEKK